MPKCTYPDCNRKKGVSDGRCRTHRGVQLSPPLSPDGQIRNDSIKKSFDHLNETVARLQKENLALNEQVGELQEFAKNQVNLNKEVVKENLALKTEINELRTKVNVANFNNDSVEQYTRRENIRLHDVPESDTETDNDVLKAIIDRANYALSKSPFFKDTTVQASDIQRAHRVGEKKQQAPGSNTPPKPRKIICRFKSWSLRQKVIKSKKALKGSPTYNGSFITEDLTQYKSKLLWYMKNHCDGKFIKCHTRNGEIHAQLKDNEDGKWHIIKSPDDLFKHGVDNVDYKLLNDSYIRFTVLKPLDTTTVKDTLNKLLNEIDVKNM